MIGRRGDIGHVGTTEHVPRTQRTANVMATRHSDRRAADMIDA